MEKEFENSWLDDSRKRLMVNMIINAVRLEIVPVNKVEAGSINNFQNTISYNVRIIIQHETSIKNNCPMIIIL